MGTLAWNFSACLVQSTAEGRFFCELVISHTCPYYGNLLFVRYHKMNSLPLSKIFFALLVLRHWILNIQGSSRLGTILTTWILVHNTSDIELTIKRTTEAYPI